MSKTAVETIVEIEWNMLLLSADGSSDITGDKEIFCGMRRSQYNEWSDSALESYLADLKKAELESRNLIIEKNIRMMKLYAPEQYEQVKANLEPISERKEVLVSEVSDLLIAQMAQCHEKYPYVTRGQQLRSFEDTKDSFSVETYQKGELMTYSEETLEKLKAHILDLAAKNENLAENILAGSIGLYGYSTLAEADKAIAESLSEVYLAPRFEGGCAGGSCSINPII